MSGSTREFVEVIPVRTNPSMVGSYFTVIRDAHTDQHYRVSSLQAAFDTGKPETLVFECDEEGNVTDWMDVAGGMYKDIPGAIDDLRTVLDGRERSLEESPMFAEYGLLGGAINTLCALLDRMQDEDNNGNA